MATIPDNIILDRVNDLAATDPQLFEALQTLGGSANDIINYLRTQDDPGITPYGPRTGTVAVTPVGSTMLVSWGSDGAPGVAIAYYIVWKAAAGTRLAPTAPTFASATIIGVIQAQNIACLPGTGTGSGYTLVDRNFSISQFDPANPSRFSYWVQSVTTGLKSSIAVSSSGTPTGDPKELVINGPGENSPDEKAPPLNMLWNASLYNPTVTLTPGPLPIPIQVSLATNASPVAITTAIAHGALTGDKVQVYNAQGNIGANGYYTFTKTGANTGTLNGSVGSGAYAPLSAFFIRHIGQPDPPVLRRTDGSCCWTPWFGTNAAIGIQMSDGSQNSGEIIIPAPGAGVEYGFGQGLDPTRIRYGQHLAISVWVRRIGAVAGTSQAVFQLAAINSTVLEGIIDASLLTTVYQRFTWNLVVPTTGTVGVNGAMSVSFRNRCLTGAGVQISYTRPMMNPGDVATGWVNVLDDGPVVGATNTLYTDPTTPNWSRVVNQVIVRDPSAVYA